MGKELVRQGGFYEGSWVGQFRAADRNTARLFMQAVADTMADMGVSDVGFEVREGSGAEFSDDEARITMTEPVPKSVLHESVSNEEVQRQLKEFHRGDDDH